ncbi:calymmin [Festucalex cinctus]
MSQGYGGGTQNGNKGQMKGALGGNGAKPNALGGAGRKPVKGYSQPYYRAGPGAGVGASHGQGVPQLAKNQAYGGYGMKPMGGYTAGYGSAGMGLGPRYGSGGIKGPKPVYGGARSQNGIGGIPTGYGYPSGGTNYPVKPGYGNGVKPNGYGANRGGYATGVLPNGYGAKPNGHGTVAGGMKGYGARPNGAGAGNGAALGRSGNKLTGFAQMPYAKGPKMPGAPNGKGLKGDVLPPQQPGSPLREGASPRRPIIEGDGLSAPEATSGRLVLVTQDQYQKLPSLVPQGKNYMHSQADSTPAYAVPIFPPGKEPKLGPETSLGPALVKPLAKSVKPPSYDAGQAGGRPVALPQENGGGASISKGQGAKAGKPDCGPGGPNGQWMKIPRPGYGAGADVLNRFGTHPGYGAGGYAGPNHAYGAVYRQGANLGGAGYVKGNSYLGNAGPGDSLKAGYSNGYVAGVQPDYANLGHGVPASDAKSAGGGVQVPYNGVDVLISTGANQPEPEPEPAGLRPNGKQGRVYGGMEGLPYGGQPGMGPEKAKYGIGGLQFGGNPQTGNNGGNGIYGPAADVIPGRYGYGSIPNTGHLLGLVNNGHMAGKYGYGKMPQELQPVGFVPQLKSPGTGQYVPSGPGALPYQSSPLVIGPNMNYGGGGEGKPAGKHVDNLGLLHQGQPLQSASDSRSGSPYESQPGTAENTNVRGDPNLSRASESMANNNYENVGYISGSKLQPEVISLPAVPSPWPLDSAFMPARMDDRNSDLTGAGLAFNHDTARGSEQPDDPEQRPRQLHIQQQLKLHIHPQGSKNDKYDLNGFFGNGGYQG